MGHTIESAIVDMGGMNTLRALQDLFFLAFDSRLDGYAKRAGTKVGPDTLEPVILSSTNTRKKSHRRVSWRLGVRRTRRDESSARFTASTTSGCRPRRQKSRSPGATTTSQRRRVTAANNPDELFKVPCQFTIPHNIMGTPALSLPLAMHSSGVPIGVQIAGRPADEHLLLQLGNALEKAMPWHDRLPANHVSHW